MNKFRVLIEGNDGNEKRFVESIDVEAKDEDDAKIKANKAFMIPGPQGISHKYDNGPKGVTHWISGVIKLDFKINHVD